MERMLQLYCLGPAKAGTHSFAGLFQPFYRTGHEAEKEALIERIQAHSNGEIDRDEFAAFLRHRDQRLGLDVDSSVYNFFAMDVLADAFPRARFVFLLRDCLSWADSCYNNFLAGITPSEEMPFWDYWFESERYRHEPQEALLAERGTYPLRCLLDAWARAIRTTLETLPEERRMLIRTRELRQKLPAIAEFAGVDAASLNPANSHLFKARRKYGLVARLNGGFLERTAEAACGELMRTYFPEKSPLEWAFEGETLRMKTQESILARLAEKLRSGDPSSETAQD
ncbi:MAG: hypothetical protein AAF560_25120 [Acidobacteriota bacterium]